MTNQKLQHDIDEAKAAYAQVSLSASEKVALKNLVLDATQTATPLSVQSSRSMPALWLQWRFYMRAVPVAFLVFVLIGAPVVFAAERSLPGDTLYGIKTVVNEEVRAALVPATEKDEYYQTLLAKRASEVRVLAKRGELTEDRVEIVQEVLASNVTEALRASETSGEPEEDVLQDHQAIVVLVTMSEEIVDAAQSAGNTLAAVQAAESATTDAIMTEPSVHEKFDAMREEASAALSAHVAALATADTVVVQDIVDELVEDARIKVAEVLRESPRPDAVVPVLETAPIMVPVAVPVEAVEPVQAAARMVQEAVVADTTGIADAEVLMITGTERVPDATVEEVLRVHERLTRERSERTVNALVNALEGTHDSVDRANDDESDTVPAR